MPSQMLHDSALNDLRKGFTGEILTPEDPAYAETRPVFNAMLDRYPAVITLPRNEAEVARAVAYGREEGLQIAVRGGGHSVAGNSTPSASSNVSAREMAFGESKPYRTSG